MGIRSQENGGIICWKNTLNLKISHKVFTKFAIKLFIVEPSPYLKIIDLNYCVLLYEK